MKKIPTLFLRDHETNLRYVSREVHPDCQWVIDGEGTATRKHDGTCVLLRSYGVFKRREVKRGKPEPAGFELVETDVTTGKRVGWIEVGDAPEDKWHREAVRNQVGLIEDGTYELCGPKIQGNPEGHPSHILIRHGAVPLIQAPRSFDALREWLHAHPYEGVVWHHPDGRMAKIKKKDFPAP